MTEANPLQQNAQWFKDRTGCLTASRMAKILPGARGAYLKSRADLMDDIIAERLTGDMADSFTTPAMQWGIDTEPKARDEYSIQTCERVELVGFIRHPTIEWLGASPDGLVDSDGLLEIKCPSTTTHLRYIANGVVPPEYKPQIITQLIVTGRKWCDFVSYDPRLNDDYERLRFFCVRYEPTAEERSAIESEAVKFLNETQERIDELLEKINA